MNESCVACLLGKNLNKYPPTSTQEQIDRYGAEVCRTIEESKELSAPEVVERLTELRTSFFGKEEEYDAIKKHFNSLMLTIEPRLQEMVQQATDPLVRAIQYAMAGNFIDFGALENVDEEKLLQMLDAADRTKLNLKTVEKLRCEILNAKRIVYFTDNCGEIVADKVLLATIRKMNPSLYITVIVRGQNVLNDATEDDAAQIGLHEVADEIFGNGTRIAGTVLTRVNERTVSATRVADVLIAKGQGNYESLCGCGLNLYYIFMCKCALFVNRFDVPLYSGILTRERE